MAGDAGRAQSHKHTRSRVLVARVAIEQSVRPKKREPVLMLGHLLHGCPPTAHCVALLAFLAKLSLVKIRVAIGAISAYIRKDQLHVALTAGHRCMRPSKRIRGFIVVEIRCAPDRAPACRGMTAFAGNPQGSVRIAGPPGLGSRVGPRTDRGTDHHQDKNGQLPPAKVRRAEYLEQPCT